MNREAYDASRVMEAWLGSEGLSGGSICGKATLALEEASLAGQPCTVGTQVTEVDDSDEGEAGGAAAEGEAARREAEMHQGSREQTKRLRQLTLLELMQPRM